MATGISMETKLGLNGEVIKLVDRKKLDLFILLLLLSLELLLFFFSTNVSLSVRVRVRSSSRVLSSSSNRKLYIIY